MIDDLTADKRARQFWEAYTDSARIGVKKFEILQFGNCTELANELATQVVAGSKRTMTILLRDFAKLGKRIPKPGDFGVVVDGENLPRCILRILQVEIRSLGDVDERFAWDEGGGDRSLKWWRSAHARYFKWQGAREGFTVTDGIELVLARFTVVWPPELSDQP